MSDLLARLRQVDPPGGSEHGTRWYRNPEGPEAADRIEALEAEVQIRAGHTLDLQQNVTRLEAEIGRLRADVRIVVTNIGGPRDPENNADWWAAVDRLRATLGEEDE